MQYLFGLKVAKGYQVLFIIIVVVGAVASLDVVWDIADTFNGLMAIPNFIALLRPLRRRGEAHERVFCG